MNAFSKLDRSEIRPVLAAVNPLVDGSPFESETATVLAQPLPFYPGYLLLHITDHDMTPAKQIFAVYKPGHAAILDSSSETIYRLNRDIPVRLGEENIISYVRFFFGRVTGRYGRFIITESVDEIDWKEDPPPAARKAIGELLAPVTLEDRRPDGTFRLTARMTFRNSLFQADIHVTPGGEISLKNEELVLEDMPVFDNVLNQ